MFQESFPIVYARDVQRALGFCRDLGNQVLVASRR
jgi:hypothetical protein